VCCAVRAGENPDHDNRDYYETHDSVHLFPPRLELVGGQPGDPTEALFGGSNSGGSTVAQTTSRQELSCERFSTVAVE
jgi:hypothetical protein